MLLTLARRGVLRHAHHFSRSKSTPNTPEHVSSRILGGSIELVSGSFLIEEHKRQRTPHISNHITQNIHDTVQRDRMNTPVETMKYRLTFSNWCSMRAQHLKFTIQGWGGDHTFQSTEPPATNNQTPKSDARAAASLESRSVRAK